MSLYIIILHDITGTGDLHGPGAGDLHGPGVGDPHGPGTGVLYMIRSGGHPGAGDPVMDMVMAGVLDGDMVPVGVRGGDVRSMQTIIPALTDLQDHMLVGRLTVLVPIMTAVTVVQAAIVTIFPETATARRRVQLTQETAEVIMIIPLPTGRILLP